MSRLKVFTPYLSGCAPRLLTLQFLMILRPFLGGMGFTLIVPLMSFIGMSQFPDNSTLNFILSRLPEFRNLEAVLVFLMITLLIVASVQYCAARLSESVEQTVLLNLRKDLHSRLLSTGWQQLSRTHSADYTRIVTEDVESVSSALDLMLNLMSQTILIVIYTGFCLLLSPTLTLVAAFTGLLLLMVSLPIQRLSNRAGEEQLLVSQAMFKLAGEQLRGLKPIKSSRTENRHLDQFIGIAAMESQASNRYASLTATSQLIYSGISAAAFCLLAWFATNQANLDLGILVILALVFSRLMPQVNGIQLQLQRLAYLTPEIEAVTDLLADSTRHREQPDPRDDYDVSTGIMVRDVSFRYPGTDHEVLHNFSAELGANELVVIAGNSGIGKTTLADLLSGLLLPDSGEIRFGDINLNRNNQRAWRRHIAYLPQEPFLIEASVRDNLTLLLDYEPDNGEIEHALICAAADFVNQLPGRLNATVGENGSTLSGGERQRLLLARALLMKRKILILDESTSQLDLTNEAVFLETLRELKRECLIIIISHRPSVWDIADQVIEINETT